MTKSKTKSAIQSVYLSNIAKGILSARMRRFDGANLFPQNIIDGRKATDRLLYRHLKTVRQSDYKFRLYDCKHTFATRAVESDMDLVVLASILGHAKLRMNMHYAHPK